MYSQFIHLIFIKLFCLFTDGKIEMVRYPPTNEGMIQSWLDRFPAPSIQNILEELWETNRKHF